MTSLTEAAQTGPTPTKMALFVVIEGLLKGDRDGASTVDEMQMSAPVDSMCDGSVEFELYERMISDGEDVQRRRQGCA